MKHRRLDPYLRTCPWKVFAVWRPIESILHRMEADGTVEVARWQVIFREDSAGGWYDAVAALRGIIQFHEIAATKLNRPANVGALEILANKLEYGSPIFETDLTAVRACIATCKSQAMQLRISEATSIVDTVRISAEMEKLQRNAA